MRVDRRPDRRASSPVESLRRIVSRVRGMAPWLETAARELGVSARTLRRELHAQHTSFGFVAEAYCTELAKQYLASGNSVKEIAFLLGFVDTNSFRRAFRTWTGARVGEFRRIQRQSAG